MAAEHKELTEYFQKVLDDARKAHPEVAVLVSFAVRDAANKGYDTQTLVSSREWLSLFLRALWDFSQAALEPEQPESKSKSLH